jgi:hypothetical protein
MADQIGDREIAYMPVTMENLDSALITTLGGAGRREFRGRAFLAPSPAPCRSRGFQDKGMWG